MRTEIEKKRFLLLTLSPLHIGDGEELIPFEYLVEERKIKVYPFYYLSSEIAKAFSGKELEQKLILFKEYARNSFQKSLKEFFQEIKCEIKPKYELENRVGEFTGVNIKTFIKTLEGAYIPGSEIKGALRTAFLYWILKENEKEKSFFINEVKKFLKENKDKKLSLKEWNIFSQKIENKILRASEKDAKWDLFKAVLASDSEIIPWENFWIGKIKVLNSSRSIDEPCEILATSSKVYLEVSIDHTKLEGLKISFLGKNPYLTSLSFATLREATFTFYLDLLEAEKAFVKTRLKELDLQKSLFTQLDKLEENFRKLSKKQTSIILPLRIGKHQGIMSLTLDLILQKEEPEIFEELFRKSAPQVRAEINKTRKIVVYKERSKDGKIEEKSRFLGWIVLVER